MSISVKNITKNYGEQKALDNVSFDIQPGEVVGFLGPNGAGKSTMMKILTCFIPQTKGTAEVCGFDVEEKSISVRKNVGYLPEHNPLYLDMYVKEYLQFIAGLHRMKATGQLLDRIIDVVGLGIEQNKQIGQLSKGFRQRVGLAQALIHDPRVLILDEPTSGLDPNQIVEIRDLIKDIGEKKTIMMSTHIMQEVEAICDRVIIVHKGRIVADDKAENMRKIRAGKEFIRVEFNREVKKEALLRVNGVVDALNMEGNTWRIETETEGDARDRIFKFSVDSGLTVLTLQREEQKLEDIFKKLTLDTTE